ncbi:MAG: hypothetical protein FE78DRAFT_458607 [Acidomyces sp. 'richmondensis']|nr:MAG: hypothetical protein FE78DRAFT_458607 [Acidomyces sp. 'richmondensis']
MRLKSAQSENALLRKRLADAESLMQARRQRKKGNRIALKAQKKLKKNAKQRAKATYIENVEEEALRTVSSDSDSDCIIVAATRSS